MLLFLAAIYLAEGRCFTVFAAERMDTTLILELNRKAMELAASDGATALRFAGQALRLSGESGYNRGMALSNLRIGAIRYHQGDHELSMTFFAKALALSRRGGNLQEEGQVFYYIGNVMHKEGKADSAISCYLKSAEIFGRLQLYDKMASAYLKTGGIYTVLDKSSAAVYFFKALEIGVSKKDTSLEAASYQQLGNLMAQEEKFDSAEVYYIHSARLYRMLGKTRNVALLQTNLGNIAFERKDYRKAERNYLDALQTQRELGNKHSEVLILTNLANVYSNRRNYQRSNAFFAQALDIARVTDYRSIVPNILEGLFLNHQEAGNKEEAIGYYLAMDSIKDRLFNEQVTDRIAEINTRYQTRLKEQQLAAQIEENRQKVFERNVMTVIGALLFVTLSIALMAYYLKRKDNRILTCQKYTIEKREKEKELLLKELHHRVKNNLQLISSLLNLQALRLNDRAAADAVKVGQSRVEAMAIIHRSLYLTDNCMDVNLKDYIDKMVVNLSYSYGYDNDSMAAGIHVQSVSVDADVAIPLGLILNELLTNVFKHAFRSNPAPELYISLELTAAGCLRLIIRDNGPGPAKTGAGDSGFGSNMISTLVSQIDAKMVTHSDKGYVVTIDVPLRPGILAEKPQAYA